MDARFDLNGVAFVWDAAKALRNQHKHGVSFEQAAEAFFDPFLRLVDADRNQEPRDAVIGYEVNNLGVVPVARPGRGAPLDPRERERHRRRR